MAWIRVQEQSNAYSNDHQTFVVTLDTGATNGNLLVLFVAVESDQAVTSVTDNGTGATNSWQLAAERFHTVSSFKGSVYWCVNQCTTGTLTTVTVTYVAADVQYNTGVVREFSGNAASPYDDSSTSDATASHVSGTDVISSGNVTPTQSGDLLVACSNAGNGGAGVTLGTDFTDLFYRTNGNLDIEMAHRTLPDTTDATAVFSDTAGGNHICIGVAFKALEQIVAGLMWL